MFIQYKWKTLLHDGSFKVVISLIYKGVKLDGVFFHQIDKIKLKHFGHRTKMKKSIH